MCAEDDAVVIEVEDNGVGMEEATQQWYGLSIIYAIVRNHDGQIAVESEQGRGTMFKVMLPVVKKSYPQMDADEKAAQDLQSLNWKVPYSDEKADFIYHRPEIQILKIPPKRGNSNLLECGVLLF